MNGNEKLRAAELLKGTTPGPWKLERGFNFDGENLCDKIALECGTVALVDVCEEDMALIAAAPDLARELAEAREDAFEFHGRIHPPGGFRFLGCRYCVAEVEARRTGARAEAILGPKPKEGKP